MRAHLLAFTLAIILLLPPLQPGWAKSNDTNQNSTPIDDLNLPSALSEDDSFDDLPFEQLRQALREEVEYGPKGGISNRSSKRYNLLIR